MISRFATFTGAALVVSSCTAFHNITDENASNSGIGNAIVIDDARLEPSRGGFVTIVQSHVRGMTVSRSGACPHIVLRAGSRSEATEPLVYVDGQRLSDTCVLETLNVDAVDRAEVYPSGVTNRPGYHSNNGGLILIFMKDGSDAQLW